jgi:hypothetical protein
VALGSRQLAAFSPDSRRLLAAIADVACMALITSTSVRTSWLALVAAVLLAHGMHTPASGSTAARNHVETAAAEQAEAVDPPGIYGADPEFTAVVETAIDRFNTVGLTLPDLRIYYHSDPSACPGAIGLFNQDGSGTRVDLCTQVAYTLLHELAHAWEYHTLSDATRQAYLNHVGLTSWASPDVDWEDRGVEHAAWTVAWGLLETPITNPAAFVDELRSFQLLTGIASPRIQGS